MFRELQEDADVRLARRITRDTVERGRDVNSVLEQYAKFVKPAFDDFVLPSKKFADVIIPRGGDNHVAIDLIVQHIRTKLGQHDLCKIYPNVFVINSTFQIRGMHTLIRDKTIATPDFVFYSDRLIRLKISWLDFVLSLTEKNFVLGWKKFDCYDTEALSALPVVPQNSSTLLPPNVVASNSYNPEATKQGNNPKEISVVQFVDDCK